MSMPFDSAVSDAKEVVSESAESQLVTDLTEPCSIDARFFDEHAQRATRYSMSIVGRWADAEEVTQEAFCKLIQNGSISRIGSQSAARAVLFTTVRNLSIDCLRKRGKRKFEQLDDNYLAAPGIPDSGGAKLENLEAKIATAMNDLPNEWAEALRLKINGKLSYDEIGKVLEATSGQVRMWIFRGRKQLQTELRKAGLLEQKS